VEETTWNKLHVQCLENIYASYHLQWAGHIVSAALQATQHVNSCRKLFKTLYYSVTFECVFAACKLQSTGDNIV